MSNYPAGYQEPESLDHYIARLEQERDLAIEELEDWRFTNKIDELQRSHDALQVKLMELEKKEQSK